MNMHQVMHTRVVLVYFHNAVLACVFITVFQTVCDPLLFITHMVPRTRFDATSRII